MGVQSTGKQNVDHSFVIINACYTITERYRALLVELGKENHLSENEMLVLIHLGIYPEARTQKQLQETKLNLSISSICRMVDSLRKKGYLTTRLDENDRRSWIISVEEMGDTIVAEFHARLEGIINGIFASVPAFNAEEFIATMSCVRAAASHRPLGEGLLTVS